MPHGISSKLYIIQFRTDASLAHEQECYDEELAGCGYELVYLNAVKGELPSKIPVDTFGVIMGGSGQFYLSAERVRKEEWIKNTIDFINLLLDNNIPLLGVCYGGHLLAYNQGAKLTNDKSLQEVGTYKVNLLEAAKTDPIFSNLKSEFNAQFGHKITPINLPKNLIQLVRSKKVSCQAFRISGKFAWGLMFHPELNQKRMEKRVKLFPEYVPKDKTMEDLLEDFLNTPEAAKILYLFVNFIKKNRKK